MLETAVLLRKSRYATTGSVGVVSDAVGGRNRSEQTKKKEIELVAEKQWPHFKSSTNRRSHVTYDRGIQISKCFGHARHGGFGILSICVQQRSRTCTRSDR